MDTNKVSVAFCLSCGFYSATIRPLVNSFTMSHDYIVEVCISFFCTTVLCSASLVNAAQRCIKAVYRPYGLVWLFFCIFTAALLQLSVSLPQHQRSHKMHCCRERKTAFVQPFCSARCSANKSLKQRCFNIFCIIRVHIQVNFSAFHSTYHSAP